MDETDRREKDRKYREWVDEEYWRQEREHFEMFGEWSEWFSGRYKPHWQGRCEELVLQKEREDARKAEYERELAQKQIEWEREEKEREEAEERRRREEFDERMRQLYAPIQALTEAADRAERRAKGDG